MSRTWLGAALRTWTVVTLAGAGIATALDAILLQRKINYFTGGFLAVDHLRSLPEAAAFLLSSFVVDACAIGAMTAAVLWLASRCRLRPAAAGAAALMGAILPIGVSNVISYQILAYLGDAFDFWLLFGLVRYDPREIIAVASGHLGQVAWLLGGALVVLMGALWGVARWRGSGRSAPAASAARAPAFRLVAAVVLLGTLFTAAAGTASAVLENGLRRKPTGRFFVVAVNALTDVDRDGYGLLSRPADPNPFDARIHPYAVDIPGNGIDENGVGGDLPPGPAYTEPHGPGPAWRVTPDVVLIMLESVRADAVGHVHEGRQVTPVLDEIAGRGVSVPLAYSHNGYTVESRLHTLSGSLAGLRGESLLIDDFAAHGYETAFFSAQDESFGGAAFEAPFLRSEVAYDARADRDRRYSASATPGSLAVSHTVLAERVAAFLESRTPDRPLFLYVNFHDTHFPYTHRDIEPLLTTAAIERGRIGPREQALLWETYLNTLSNVDRAIGRLLADARRTLGREPAVIVLSDHGESLYDDGLLGHGFALSDTQTRIPVIAANLPIRLKEPFGQADLRDAIRSALASEDAAAPPRIVRDPSRQVFQYLGSLERPVQIGFVGVNGRTIYDFRTRRARLGDGPWRNPDHLQGADRQAFEALVHHWERMLLARHEAGL